MNVVTRTSPRSLRALAAASTLAVAAGLLVTVPAAPASAAPAGPAPASPAASRPASPASITATAAVADPAPADTVSDLRRGAPVAPGIVRLTQPDGSVLRAVPWGDAALHGVEDVRGYTLVRATRGWWHWASAVREGRLVPGPVATTSRGRAAAATRGITKHLRPAAPARPDYGAGRSGRATPRAIQNSGVAPTLVILAQYADTPASTSPGSWAEKYFGSSDSVRAFYSSASQGKFTISPAADSSGPSDGVVGWVEIGATHPNYGSPSLSQSNGIIRAALAKADAFVDFSAFDTNRDGAISPTELHVTVILAGNETATVSECAANIGQGIWGHKWQLAASTSSGSSDKRDGVVVGRQGYTLFGELHRVGCGSANQATIGIMVHELGHDLGWPDLYDVDYTSQGIGEWSIMAGGSWNTSGNLPYGARPALPDAWSRYYQGWVTPTVITSGTRAVSVKAASATGQTVFLVGASGNPRGVDWTFQEESGTGEYFLVENRQQSGWDSGLPGCGLLIWHIDETRTSSNYANSNESRRLVDLEEASGTEPLSTASGWASGSDPWPGTTGKKTFSGTSTPSSRLYNGDPSGATIKVTSNSCADTMTAEVTFAGAGGGGGGEEPAPANDNLANATVLTGSSGLVTGTTTSATKQTGEPIHAGNAGGASVWFSFTPESTGKLTLTTADSTFNTLLAVYTGSNVASLNPLASNDNAVSVTTSAITNLNVTQGTTYRIAVDGFKGTGAVARGAYSLGYTLTPNGPVNDPFSNATVLTGGTGSVTGTNVAATKQTGEPAHAGNSGGASIWWSYTPAADGSLNVRTDGSVNASTGDPLDTVLAIYTGSSVSTLTGLAYDDDSGDDRTSFLEAIPVVGGTTYWIAVDGYNSFWSGLPTGSVSLAYSFKASGRVTANDDFADAEALTGISGTVIGTTVGATIEPGEPEHAFNANSASIWYSYTPDVDGQLTLSTAGSDFDTKVAVYTGSTLTTLDWVYSNDDEVSMDITTSLIEDLGVTAGMTYWIAVDGFTIDDVEAGVVNLTYTFTAAQPPSVPQSVSVSGTDFGEATVTWAAPADSGGSPITGYVISVDGQSTVSAQSWDDSAVITDLADSPSHTFAVSAVNAMGSSIPVTVTAVMPTVSATATPTKVRPGGTVVISGKVTASGAARGGVKVELYAKRSGGSWSRIGLATASTKGVYRFTDRPRKKTSYAVLVRGGPGLLDATSGLLTVSMR